MLELLVDEIKVNDGDGFEMYVPEMFLRSHDLLQMYLRTRVFDTDLLTYSWSDVEDWLEDEKTTFISTDHLITQPLVTDLIAVYNDCLGPMKLVRIIGYCKSAMVIHLTEDDLEYAYNDRDWQPVNDAVLEKLRYYLPMDFLVMYNK